MKNQHPIKHSECNYYYFNMISAEKYPYQAWNEYFDGEVDFNKIYIRGEWGEKISHMREKNMFANITKSLNKNLSDGANIFPYPQLMFSIFDYVDVSDIHVVILGQDPYFNSETINKKIVPQATGASFSVPIGMQIPPSLQNIFKNQKEFGIVKKQPHGCLHYWLQQGCFLLNTSLSVVEGEPNCHKKEWKPITDKIITYISNKCDHVVFVLWGSDARDKMNLIDLEKHDIVISSHPSGLSCSKPLGQYKPFNQVNHFGDINEILKKYEYEPINWQLF